MEAVRRIVDADELDGIVNLPESMRKKRLVLLISSLEGKNKKDVEQTVQSLLGALPDEGLSLSDYRRERLQKYEAAD